MSDPWIPIDDYCRSYNERQGTVHKRVQDGVWQRGVHYAAPQAGTAYINEPLARAWLEEKGKLQRVATAHS